MKNKKRLFLYINLLISAVLLAGCSNMLDVPGSGKTKSGPGVTVASATGGYTVSEANGNLNLTVVLDKQPSSDVIIPLGTNDSSENFVTPNQLTFTSSNWNTPQNISITGVDDTLLDGNQDTALVFGIATSDDPSYKALIAPSVGIVVIDDEGYSIVISKSSGLQTTESGGIAKFTVVLSRAPTANVVVPSITCADSSEGSVDKSTLTFTPANFSIPQVVTVTGADEVVFDGNVDYSVHLANSSNLCADLNYRNRAYDSYQTSSAINDVSLTNEDDEVPAVVVNVVNNASTSVVYAMDLIETGGIPGTDVGTFTVVLSIKPNGTVTIPVTSADPARASVDKATLTFQPADYNVPQVVSVTAIHDNIKEPGITPVILRVGTATNYNNFDPQDVTAYITDIDSAAILVSNLSRYTNEGGQNATFYVKLTTLPTADVYVTINDTYDAKNAGNKEGTIATPGAPSKTLTFTTADWNTAQTITVTGVNDNVMDGNTQYVLRLLNAVSSDTDYNGIKPSDVIVNNLDDDIAGFTVVANSVSTDTSGSSVNFSNFATDDSNVLGSTYANFTIRLRSQPTSSVTLNLALNAAGIANNDGTLNTSSLVFTTGNWFTPQSVTVTGASNGLNEDGHEYAVNVSISTSDSRYGSTSFVRAPSFSIFSCDNDVSNLIAYCRKSGGFSTSESGGTAEFWLITRNPWISDLTVPLSVTDIYASNSSLIGTVTGSLTIQNSNWNQLEGGLNKGVITGQDDGVFPTGNTLYNVLTGTSSGAFIFNAPDFNLWNTDNDQMIIVGNKNRDTTESGGTATFGVKLGVQPAAGTTVSFTIAVKSGSTEGASLNTSSLTFNDTDWNQWKTVTITGKEDHVVDGTQPSYITCGTISSSDVRLDGARGGDFSPVNNTDNDKLIWVTDSTYFGNFNAATDMASIDATCESLADANAPGNTAAGVYKALIAHPIYRSNVKTAVFKPDTEYYLYIKGDASPYSHKIFETDSTGKPGSILLSFSGDTFWTGLNADWTISADTCGGWQNGTSLGQYGTGSTINSGSATGGNLDTKRKIIAVQQ